MSRVFTGMPRSLARLHLYSRPISRSTHAGPSRLQQQVDGATDISHSQFLAHAKSDSDFNPSQTPGAGQATLADVTGSRGSTSLGRLDPTNSHLFKLILPLPTSLTNPQKSPTRPTAFLLHPSQPLSHLSRLIAGSLPPSERGAEITYLALTGKEADLETHLRNAEAERDDDGPSPPAERQEGGPYLEERESSKGRFQEVSWSQSTDLSDFIKQSSTLNERFKIVIQPEEKEGAAQGKGTGVTLEVVIPSFASRTTYLRERLVKLGKELNVMTKNKKAIDLAAHKSARRLGTTALAAGVVYWGAVIRWTFFTDAGWDLMEPVTWATGFAALLCGTGFLIYHNREVSYSSLLDLSVSARQRSLYDKHGLDIERWTELVAEAKTLRREIKRIAADYDIEWQGELENLQNMERYSPPPTSSPGSSKSGADHPPEAQSGSAAGGDKIDIDKTIDEASELAERTKERADKAKDAERKGEAVDDRKESESGDRTAKKEKIGEERGEAKANKAIEDGV